MCFDNLKNLYIKTLANQSLRQYFVIFVFKYFLKFSIEHFGINLVIINYSNHSLKSKIIPDLKILGDILQIFSAHVYDYVSTASCKELILEN